MYQIILLALTLTSSSNAAFSAATRDTIVEFEELCKEAMRSPSRQLIEIHGDNKNLIRKAGRVKVARWMSEVSFNKRFSRLSHSPMDREVWVTIAPEVTDFCARFVKETNLLDSKSCEEVSTLRVELYLGLRPSRDKKMVLVEFYVDPSSLIRPCLNPDPRVSSCSRQNSDNTPENLPDMKSFLEAKFSNQTGGNLDPVACLPFTGIGYTFDWGSEHDRVGATEFILLPNTPIHDIEIRSIQEACGCRETETK